MGSWNQYVLYPIIAERDLERGKDVARRGNDVVGKGLWGLMGDDWNYSRCLGGCLRYQGGWGSGSSPGLMVMKKKKKLKVAYRHRRY